MRISSRTSECVMHETDSGGTVRRRATRWRERLMGTAQGYAQVLALRMPPATLQATTITPPARPRPPYRSNPSPPPRADRRGAAPDTCGQGVHLPRLRGREPCYECRFTILSCVDLFVFAFFHPVVWMNPLRPWLVTMNSALIACLEFGPLVRHHSLAGWHEPLLPLCPSSTLTPLPLT